MVEVPKAILPATAALVLACSLAALSDPLPPDATYRPFPTLPFTAVKAADEAQKPQVMQRQADLLNQRYDLSDQPIPGVMMSGGRKPIQGGVRVKLPPGVTWESLATTSPDEIRQRGLLPAGFMPLPHVKQATGGQVFPNNQIDEIGRQEARNLRRFDVDLDLPDRFTPEFPPPLFLTTHPELGDVSRGQLLTIKNYYELMVGILTPVQIEGLRLLLTPFPQEEFNQTEDRKSADQSLGVTCLDCHSNFHTNAAFHQTPDLRPQAARFRLDTVSLRGVFNQQIHGSKRSLRSVEDFTEFEQRTAYFNGDPIRPMKKGFQELPRSVIPHMSQAQNMLDFPPAPKLTVLGRLDPEKATESELRGEKLFFGKAQCAVCHPAPFYTDHLMHDLRLGGFLKGPGDGPIKSFTLRGIKESPPYLHDGRCLTLEDTVEFFNLVLQLKLNKEEKTDLVAFMRQL